ncbi:MAG: hypothetical protein MPK01_08770, partial [Gammaproteobacteria bacterium]|nr:hypothetical protein [Gammaproteobacteria bacterium]
MDVRAARGHTRPAAAKWEKCGLALVGVSKIAAINHGGKAKMTREYKCAFCKLQGVCAKKCRRFAFFCGDFAAGGRGGFRRKIRFPRGFLRRKGAICRANAGQSDMPDNGRPRLCGPLPSRSPRACGGNLCGGGGWCQVVCRKKIKSFFSDFSANDQSGGVEWRGELTEGNMDDWDSKAVDAFVRGAEFARYLLKPRVARPKPADVNPKAVTADFVPLAVLGDGLAREIGAKSKVLRLTGTVA